MLDSLYSLVVKLFKPEKSMKVTYPEMKAIYESMIDNVVKTLFSEATAAHGWSQQDFMDIYDQESLDDEHLEFAHFSMDIH